MKKYIGALFMLAVFVGAEAYVIHRVSSIQAEQDATAKAKEKWMVGLIHELPQPYIPTKKED